MFEDYYYINIDNQIIYISAISLDDCVELSFYQDNKLIKRKSLVKGFHTLTHNNIKLSLEVKLFKLKMSLFIDNKEIELEKIRRKELKRILIEKSYYNEINPRPTTKNPFNYKKLIIPVLLIIFGFIVQNLTDSKSKIWFIVAVIFYLIAYIMMTSSLVNKIHRRYADDETKSKIKFIVGMVLAAITHELILFYLK